MNHLVVKGRPKVRGVRRAAGLELVEGKVHLVDTASPLVEPYDRRCTRKAPVGSDQCHEARGYEQGKRILSTPTGHEFAPPAWAKTVCQKKPFWNASIIAM